MLQQQQGSAPGYLVPLNSHCQQQCSQLLLLLLLLPWAEP
jgi:hypothetical protein